jgi:hypothetical protein
MAASRAFRKRNGVSRTTVRIAHAMAASRASRKRNGVSRTTVRIAHAMAASWRPELSEGLPVPREPAYAAKRSQDGEAPAASE